MAAHDFTLRDRWPKHLVDRIASKNFVLVVGAGISRNCTNANGDSPPSWEALLKVLISAYTSGSHRSAANELLAHRDYLGAAELVRVRARAAGKELDFLMKIAEVTDGGKKPETQYQPAAVHESLFRLNPDVLITTNYDRIIERATSSGYNTHTYSSNTLGSDIRAGNPALIKLHGTVDSSAKMILTRSDYTRLRREGSHVLEVVQALFLTRTVFFVGYSFTDPDVHLLLENILGGKDDVAAHYLLTSKSMPAYVREIYSYSYGTTGVFYAADDFDEMQAMLRLLADEVEALRAL